MMRRLLLLAGLFLAATAGLAIGARSHASIVFNNGKHVSSGEPAFGANHAADDFFLATTTTITDVHWKGLYEGSNGNDHFTIKIWGDNGAGMPTDLGTTQPVFLQTGVSVNRTITDEIVVGDGGNVFPVFAYSAFIHPFVAEADKVYWLEIYNDVPQQIWYWSRDLGGDTDNGVTTGGGSSWIDKNYVYTFRLTDDGVSPVPEASSVAIWGIVGALGLIVGKKAIGRFC